MNLELFEKGIDCLYKLYEQNKKEWELKYKNKWIVLANEKLIGFYDTENLADDAINKYMENDEHINKNLLPGALYFQLPRNRNIHGQNWNDFHNVAKDLLIDHFNSDVENLLLFLEEKKCFFVPDSLEYNDNDKCIHILWNKKFLIKIPNHLNQNMPIIIENMRTGPIVKYYSIKEVVEHLTDNKKFYLSSRFY